MTDPDQLPAFHVPLSPTMEKAVWLSDALTAIATERARADALQAEVSQWFQEAMKVADERNAQRARADALEAALDNLVRAYDDMWLGPISISDDWDQVQGALDAQFDGRLLEARALLEKKT